MILFRTFYTLKYHQKQEDSHDDTFSPLNLIDNEEQRQLLLLPLAVSGMVMTILPAYYFLYKKYYIILVSQGVLGMALLFLFLGIALTSEKRNNNNYRSLFLTIKE